MCHCTHATTRHHLTDMLFCCWWCSEKSGYYSKATTIGQLFADACDKFGLDQKNVRMWDYHRRSRIKILDAVNARLDSEQIIDDQLILLEEKDADGTWPVPKTPASSYAYVPYLDTLTLTVRQVTPI
jgi:hypothetical protein